MEFSKEQKIAAFKWMMEHERLCEMLITETSTSMRRPTVISNAGERPKTYQSAFNALSAMHVDLAAGCKKRKKLVRCWNEFNKEYLENCVWFVNLKAEVEMQEKRS